MTISLHIICDNCPQERLDRALLYLHRVQPKYVVIGAGAQLDIGMNYVERVHRELPNIKIIWRNLAPEDTGILGKMSAKELYALKVAPYLPWFQRNGVIFQPDNESSGDDTFIRSYVAKLVEMAILLHADKLSGAFCSFATGNIGDGSHGSTNQYPLLKPLFNAMLASDIITPHEYSNAPGKSSAGHLARYDEMWIVNAKPLPTVIGEAGIAPDYDPGKGYLSIPIAGAKYAQQMLDENVWYNKGQIDRCLYLIGGFSHESYRVGDDVLEYLEGFYQRTMPPVVVQPAPPPAPKPPTATLPAELGTPVLATISSQWLLFADASSSSAIIGTLKDGEHIKQYPQTVKTVEEMKYYVVERENVPAGEAKVGWSTWPLLQSPDQPPKNPPSNAGGIGPSQLPELPPLKGEPQLTSAQMARLAVLIRQLADISNEISVMLSIAADKAA